MEFLKPPPKLIVKVKWDKTWIISVNHRAPSTGSSLKEEFHFKKASQTIRYKISLSFTCIAYKASERIQSMTQNHIYSNLLFPIPSYSPTLYSVVDSQVCLSVCLSHSLSLIQHYGSPGTVSKIKLFLKSGVVGKTQRSRTKLYLIGEDNTNKTENT